MKKLNFAESVVKQSQSDRVFIFKNDNYSNNCLHYVFIFTLVNCSCNCFENATKSIITWGENIKSAIYSV